MASLTAIQSDASKVFGHLRQSGFEAKEGHPCWMELGETLKETKIPEDKIPMLRMLSNMGVQHSDEQKQLKASIEASAPISKYLQSIEDTLKASAGDYLDGTEMTLSDVTMVCSLSPLVSFLYSVWEYPNLDKWFQLCMSRDEFQKVLGNPHLVGSKRIGNQVDERPNPMKARLGAESAQKRNVGAKKGPSQRELEKASKGKKESKPSTDGGADKKEEVTVEPFSLGEGASVEASKADRMAAIHAALGNLNIKYETVEHEATPTTEKMMEVTGHLPGGHCKNLFCKAKKPSKTRKPDSKLWLIVALHDTQVNLKGISKKFGYKDQMRFGKEDLLKEKLGVVQGEVSPLALLNNPGCDVQVALDSKMMSMERLWFHPLTMEASTGITPDDLLKFIAKSGRSCEIVDL